MRIDAHQHFWKLSRGDYDWPTPDLKQIYRDFLPEDLHDHLTSHEIDKTIVVQATPTLEETTFLLDLYERHPSIGGVVGWIDLSSEDFPLIFDKFKSHQGFLGIRPMLQNLKDDRWIVMPKVKKNIYTLVENDFPIDILLYPKHLPHIYELLTEFPTLRAVIDHCAKPNIKDKQWEPWAYYLDKITEFETVMCKISGLLTEADHQHWEIDHFKPYIHHVINSFGKSRIMFGSDWPVSLLAGSYNDVIEVLMSNLPADFTHTDIELLFGENARRFYKL